MEKVLTISIAAYNAEKYLSKCLNSLLNSNVKEKLEIIIVNDGSIDQTLEIANSFSLNYPNVVKVINKENAGHGSTINESIKVATGKYYKILDSDDWVDVDGLEKLVNYLETNTVDMVLNPYHEIYIDTGASILKKPYSENQELNKILDIIHISEVNIYMHSLTFNTSVVKQMGPIIDENCFYVDMEYTCFAVAYVKTFVCLNFPVYQYMLGSNEQSMSTKNLVKRREQHLKVLKRLVNFYINIEEDNKIKKTILNRIKYAILNQYKIYFNINDEKIAQKEIILFDQWLLNNFKIGYYGPKSRFMYIIRLLRHGKFKFFKLPYAIFYGTKI